MHVSAFRAFWAKPMHIIYANSLLLSIEDIAVQILAKPSLFAESPFVVWTFGVFLWGTCLTSLRMSIYTLAALWLRQTETCLLVSFAYWDFVFNIIMDVGTCFLGILASSEQEMHTNYGLRFWKIPGACDRIIYLMSLKVAQHWCLWACRRVVLSSLHFQFEFDYSVIESLLY